MPEIVLSGCRPRPLVGYLKALGILRVVARQTQGDSYGRWISRHGQFTLGSTLDQAALEEFLLDRFTPSPVLSPWNGGSGFFPNDRKSGIDWIEASRDKRLQPYQEAIRAARGVLDELGLEEKPATTDKPLLIRRLRRSLADEALDWLDTAVVVTGSELAFPPLLGSGGNDGRFDFSNNVMQCIAAVLDSEQRDRSSQLLRAALRGEAVPLEKRSLGHFTRDASPVNSPRGESDSLGNPWDLVLAVEGALVLAPGSSRRHSSQLAAGLAAPFTARPTAAGFGSAVAGEKGRAELWLPLWDGAATLREIEALVREARAQVGRRQARTGLDFARAAGQLGVARGITSFERYAILERAGQSSLAVPAGRVEVKPNAGAEALQTLDGWIDTVLRFGASDTAPRSIEIAARRLESAMFDLAARGSALAAQQTLERLGDLEHALANSRRAAEAGLAPLRRASATPWLEAADDGSAEFAVAVGLASLRWPGTPQRPIRDYLHGTTVEAGRRVFAPGGPREVPVLAATVSRLALIHVRGALRDAGPESSPAAAGAPLPTATATDANTARAFALGLLDDRRLMALTSGLSLLEHERGVTPPPRTVHAPPTPAFDLLVLAWRGLAGEPLRPRRGWAARLAAGQCRSVIESALLRLRQIGRVPIASVDDLVCADLDGPRLAAALLLRPNAAALRRCAERLTLAGGGAARPETPTAMAEEAPDEDP